MSTFMPDFWFKSFGSRFCLGKVQDYSYVKNEDGTDTLDEAGNRIYTGKVMVTIGDRIGQQIEVPICFASVGNSMFAGGLPEKGAICLVGFRENNLPVIVSFLPHSLDQLFTTRQEIPNLQPGEFLIQSSDTCNQTSIEDNDILGPSASAAPQYYSGARVLWDKYGRLIVKARGFECIYGPILSDEYTPNVKMVRDTLTGQVMFFRERLIGGAVERRVDQQGNEVRYNAKDLHQIIDGIFDCQALTWNLTVRKSCRIQDRHGNLIEITDEGDVNVVSAQGNVSVRSGGSIHIESQGNIEQLAIRDIIQAAGGSLDVTIAGNVMEVAGGNIKIQAGGALLLGGATVALTGGLAGGISQAVFMGDQNETIIGARQTQVGQWTITGPVIITTSLMVGAGVPLVKASFLARYLAHTHNGMVPPIGPTDPGFILPGDPLYQTTQFFGS